MELIAIPVEFIGNEFENFLKLILYNLFPNLWLLKRWMFILQDERSRGDHNLQNISKTHERMQQEQKSEPLQYMTVWSHYITPE